LPPAQFVAPTVEYRERLCAVRRRVFKGVNLAYVIGCKKETIYSSFRPKVNCWRDIPKENSVGVHSTETRILYWLYWATHSANGSIYESNLQDDLGIDNWL